MVAEAGTAADAGQTVGANGIQIPIAQSEISSAEMAVGGLALARRAARRAADDSRIVPAGRLHRYHGSTMAAKTTPDSSPRSIELAATIMAGNQQFHSRILSSDASIDSPDRRERKEPRQT
jgi:hypothetical protein